MYIRQKNSNTYVVVSEWVGELSSHPSIIEHPELFEITNDTPNEDSQYLNYVGHE